MNTINHSDCVACKTLSRELQVPGGIIFEDEYWLVDHTLPPVLIRGQLIIKLKRHCEHLAKLTPPETDTLGPIIQLICEAVSEVIKPEKIHVASYGEGIKHIHFIVTPRIEEMPTSNIRLTIWIVWRRWLNRLGWKRVVNSKEEAAEIASQIRDYLEKKNRDSR